MLEEKRGYQGNLKVPKEEGERGLDILLSLSEGA